MKWKRNDTIVRRYAKQKAPASLTLELLDDGILPNTYDDSGQTLLHIAIQLNEDAALILIDAGADPNGDNPKRDVGPPIHTAVINYRIFKALIDAGADIFRLTNAQRNVVDSTMKQNWFKYGKDLIRVLEFSLNAGVDPSALNEYEACALDQAVDVDWLKKVVETFSQYGYEYNQPPTGGGAW
ncbi:ankyrin repeat domain-containing protein [Novipirellula sp. SH528]|uniref:ankyrin repeat domain-containing protein n=1 Tax=Novipirellula sp. SH528 TaxID=3454466 RepID=UPI003FA08C91